MKNVCIRRLFITAILTTYAVWITVFGLPHRALAASETGEAVQQKAYDLSQIPKAHVAHWIEAYGLADPETNPLVKRAYKIFETVRAVADKRGNRLPRLRIVNSDGDPWAIALLDGFIILSKQAVEICYNGVNQEGVGDARMAFVLGHELGHMADDDFWHFETLMALSSETAETGKTRKPHPEIVRLKKILEDSSDIPTAEKEKRLAAARVKEVKADDKGFLYAAVAGYRVDMLLGDEKQNFFTHWMDQVPHKIDKKHPTPKERAKFLRSRLKGLLDKVNYFKFGVRLAHFQRYEDAVYFFRDFQKVFPSREVFNNLGYCYLQMAVAEMPPDVAYKFWFPSIIDVVTQADTLALRGFTRGIPEISETARQFLEEAVEYLKRACNSDQMYLPSRINLATACLYLGKIYDARAIIEEARQIAPENPEIQGMRAVIMYREDPVADMGPRAIKTLEALADKPDAPLFIPYNLAVLLEERGRSGNAQKIWTKLAGKAAQLPGPYREEVARRTQLSIPEKARTVKLTWPLPVEVGTDLLESKKAKNLLTGWKQTAFNWYKGKLAGDIYYTEIGDASVLKLDDYVEMVVLSGSELGTAEALKRRCGKPLLEKTVAGGTLCSYGPQWTALVRDGKVLEIWVARR